MIAFFLRGESTSVAFGDTSLIAARSKLQPILGHARAISAAEEKGADAAESACNDISTRSIGDLSG